MTVHDDNHDHDEPYGLDLPDLDELLAKATRHRDMFQAHVQAAQAEVDKANRYIAALTGRPAKAGTGGRKPKKHSAVSDTYYLQVLAAVGQHRYASAETVSRTSGASPSHARVALKLAAERGHVLRQKRGHNYRYTITDAGLELATSSPSMVSA